MATDLDRSIEFLRTAGPLEIFSNPKTKDDLEREYRRLMMTFHPDRHADSLDYLLATEATSIINTAKATATEMLEKGITSAFNIEVSVGRRKIVFTDLFHDGDLSFILRHDNDLLKVIRNPGEDTDFLQREQKALKVLRQHDHFKRYLPGPMREVAVTINGKVHPAHHFEYIQGYTLEEVMDHYSEGVSPRQAAWMINRLLEVLCWSHEQGIAHMAVLPRHFLIFPDNHRGVLLDWSFSTKGKPVAVAAQRRGEKYPELVYTKPDDVRIADVTMAFDIFRMLVKDESKIPVDIRKFTNQKFSGETFRIYKRFQKVLDSVWERKFIPFSM